MPWNYRVIHETVTLPGNSGKEEFYAIYEVYSNEQGNITGWTAGNAIQVMLAGKPCSVTY